MSHLQSFSSSQSAAQRERFEGNPPHALRRNVHGQRRRESSSCSRRQAVGQALHAVRLSASSKECGFPLQHLALALEKQWKTYICRLKKLERDMSLQVQKVIQIYQIATQVSMDHNLNVPEEDWVSRFTGILPLYDPKILPILKDLSREQTDAGYNSLRRQLSKKREMPMQDKEILQQILRSLLQSIKKADLPDQRFEGGDRTWNAFKKQRFWLPFQSMTREQLPNHKLLSNHISQTMSKFIGKAILRGQEEREKVIESIIQQYHNEQYHYSSDDASDSDA